MENLKKFFLVVIFVVPFLGSAQITFYNKFTSGPYDQGNGLTQLPDSSYAITGSSGGFDMNSSQAFLMLVDSLGDHLWTKSFGGSGDDIGIRIFHVPGDGFFIAGYTGSTLAGDFDFIVYKTDELGNLLWEKKYGGTNWERLYDAKLLADGGLILVGHTEGPTTNGTDIFMVRTDAIGDTIWTKVIQTPNDDVAYAVDTLSSTQFVVGGDMGDAGDLKGMISGFHIDGTQEWLEFYDQNGITTVRDIQVYNNEIYLVGGLYNSTNDFYDAWFAKGDITGVFFTDWNAEYQGASLNTAITIRDFSSAYLAMQSQSPELNPFSGGNDVFTFKFNTNTDYVGPNQGFSGVDEDIINQMIVDSDGGIVLVGTVSDMELSTSSGTDIMIARIGPGDEVQTYANTDLDYVSIAKEKLSMMAVHPNPTRDLINFPDNVLGLSYKLLNFQGQIVMKGQIEPTISLMELNPGIYMMSIEGEEQIWTSKIIKQ